MKIRAVTTISVCIASAGTAVGGQAITHRIIGGVGESETVQCDGSPIPYAGFGMPTVVGDRVLFYQSTFDECGGVYEVPFDGGAIVSLFTDGSFAPSHAIAHPKIGNTASGFPVPAVHILNAWPERGPDGRTAFNTFGTSIAIGELDGSARIVGFPEEKLGPLNFRDAGLPVFWNGGVVVPADFQLQVRGGGPFGGGTLEFVGFRSLVSIDADTIPPTYTILAESGEMLDGEMYDDFGSNYFDAENPNHEFGVSSSITPSLAVDGDTLYFRARSSDDVRDAIFSLTPGGVPTKVFDRTTPVTGEGQVLRGLSSVMDAEGGLLVFAGVTGPYPSRAVFLYDGNEIIRIADQSLIENAVGGSFPPLEMQQVAVSDGRVALFAGSISEPFFSVILVYERGLLCPVLQTGDTIPSPDGSADRLVLGVRMGSQGFEGEHLVSRPFIAPGGILGTGIVATTISFLPTCAGDCDRSEVVDFNDLLCMLFEFGNDNSLADCDESGVVDFNDLVCALFAFGPCE